MIKGPTIRQLSKRAEKFCAIQSVHDLIVLLNEEDHLFMYQLAHPKYHVFDIPKKDGSKRTIENPDVHLKRMLAKLNDYLQAVYYLHRSDAAYGFIINPEDDPTPRHIVSNAKEHVNKAWLLNIDVEDFFHYVKETMVREVFRKPPFQFESGLAEALARLTTYKGRLPMGAPTSPVISNLAVIDLDRQISTLCVETGWHFTRYADDMSFSSDIPIKGTDIKQLEKIVQRHGYEFNPLKIKIFPPEGASVHVEEYGNYAPFLFDPGTPKIITGVQLGENGIELPEAFIIRLHTEIARLKEIITVQTHLWHENSEWVEQYQKQIEGMLAFAANVLGKHHGTFRALKVAYIQAQEPPEEHEGISWLDFPYF